jgi:hypothetical protein
MKTDLARMTAQHRQMLRHVGTEAMLAAAIASVILISFIIAGLR